MRPEPVNPPFVSLRLAEDGAKNWGWQALNWIWRVLWNLWVLLREMTGDTAYERYLTHMAQSHPGRALMSQQEYFKFRLDQKWNRISRCC